MNFQNLAKIEDSDFYLDRAFREASKIKANKKGNKFKNIQQAEIKKVKTFSKTLTNLFEYLVKSFPSIDNLPLFYQEMIELHIGTDKLKKELATVYWMKDKIKEFSIETQKNINKEKNVTKLKELKKPFFGRVSSILKKKKKTFKFLEEARKKMRKFPSVKTNIPTICIAGYPNVGKSTLLKKLTGAGVEINLYPFTTKGLMMGYINKKIQLIDTPGTFSNEEKMNYIEKQAFLALKYLAERIIFVFDLSESSGYEIDKQEELLNLLKKRFRGKEIIIFFSKKDLIDKKSIEKYEKIYEKHKNFNSANKLKSFLLK